MIFGMAYLVLQWEQAKLFEDIIDMRGRGTHEDRRSIGDQL